MKKITIKKCTINEYNNWFNLEKEIWKVLCKLEPGQDVILMPGKNDHKVFAKAVEEAYAIYLSGGGYQ